MPCRTAYPNEKRPTITDRQPYDFDPSDSIFQAATQYVIPICRTTTPSKEGLPHEPPKQSIPPQSRGNHLVWWNRDCDAHADWRWTVGGFKTKTDPGTAPPSPAKWNRFPENPPLGGRADPLRFLFEEFSKQNTDKARRKTSLHQPDLRPAGENVTGRPTLRPIRYAQGTDKITVMVRVSLIRFQVWYHPLWGNCAW